MSVKKFLVLSAAGIAALAATGAYAGGPDRMAPPAPVDDSGIYIDVDAGWAHSDWANFWGGIYNTAAMAPAGGGISSGGGSGFTWGADLGYQFNRNLSAELGWYQFRKVVGAQAVAVAAVTSGLTNVATRSWILYFAGKLSIPVYDNIDLFGKAGLVWRNLSRSGPGMGLIPVNNAIPTSSHYWAPFLGFGGQWWLTHAWSLNLQYMHVPSYSRSAGPSLTVTAANDVAKQSPSVNMIVAGVGYKFAT